MPDWLIDLLDLNADDLLQRLRPMLFGESVDRSSCVTADDFVTLTLICLCEKGIPSAAQHLVVLCSALFRTGKH
jgi:hypothetical protein